MLNLKGMLGNIKFAIKSYSKAMIFPSRFNNMVRRAAVQLLRMVRRAAVQLLRMVRRAAVQLLWMFVRKSSARIIFKIAGCVHGHKYSGRVRFFVAWLWTIQLSGFPGLD